MGPKVILYGRKGDGLWETRQCDHRIDFSSRIYLFYRCFYLHREYQSGIHGLIGAYLWEPLLSKVHVCGNVIQILHRLGEYIFLCNNHYLFDIFAVFYFLNVLVVF